MDRIELGDFDVDCVIGVLASEQVKTQRVVVNVEMGLDLEGAGDTADLRLSVNYASIRDQVRFLLHTGRWPLLESVAVASCRLILAPPDPAEGRAQVDEVAIRLRKPEILDDATPGIQMRRSADGAAARARPGAPVHTEVLVETPRAGAYRVRLRAGEAVDVPPGAAVFVIAGTVHGNASYATGDSVARMLETALRADSKGGAVLLIVSIPPL